jgi:hypothetical protein
MLGTASFCCSRHWAIGALTHGVKALGYRRVGTWWFHGRQCICVRWMGERRGVRVLQPRCMTGSHARALAVVCAGDLDTDQLLLCIPAVAATLPHHQRAVPVPVPVPVPHHQRASHSQGIMHRDVKPHKRMVNSRVISCNSSSCVLEIRTLIC